MLVDFAAGGSRQGRFVGRREARAWGRRAQRASWTDSPRLFDHSEQSERRELRGATPGRASQWSRRKAPTAPPESPWRVPPAATHWTCAWTDVREQPQRAGGL